MVKAAFYEGYPNGTLAGNYSAAWMVEQVRKYPGEVMIYSGGALTNIAMAVRLDPEFASLAKGLVIMGGYIDVTLLQTSGSTMQADLNSDVSVHVVDRVLVERRGSDVNEYSRLISRSTRKVPRWPSLPIFRALVSPIISPKPLHTQG